MFKKILLGFGCIVLLLIIIEGSALLILKSHIKSYASYWTQQNQSATGSFTYVALGDSAAQGIGASKPQNSYVGLVAQRIQAKTGKKVRLVNLSASGAKINDVLTKQMPKLAAYKPDLVTIEIGANNLAHYNAQQFQTQFATLAAELPANTYVANMPYFGGRIMVNPQALLANKYIVHDVQEHHLNLVDLQTMTKQRQSIRNYAADFFHPSNQGYVNWADAFWLTIEPRLQG